MASSQPIPVIPELRIKTNISMQVFGFSVNVSSVRDVSSLLILQGILCPEF
jgi:hypothetical protein